MMLTEVKPHYFWLIEAACYDWPHGLLRLAKGAMRPIALEGTIVAATDLSNRTGNWAAAAKTALLLTCS
jgi:hypothetical protein